MATVYKRGGNGNRDGQYYIAYFDHQGKRVSRSARTSDRAAAERIAAKMEADAALRREGVIDPVLDGICRESRRTIESHLVDYEAKFRTVDRSDDHIKRTLRLIRWICENAGFVVAIDISADGVTRAASQLKKNGRSARTIQAYLTAIKGFTRWLAENHKLPRDPLSSVRKPNPKADRRRERRMLLPGEWKCLEASTTNGPIYRSVPPHERVLLYNTAIQTGLRSSELRSLTTGRLFFDKTRPYIVCKAGSAKNRKDARQYIEPELAAGLRAHVAQKTPTDPVFRMPSKSAVSKMLRADLAAARAQWLKGALDDPAEYARRQGSDFLLKTNHEGEVLDFHSLRHTCGAWLTMTGAHPKIVQSVMRHSSITLTLDTYGHLFPGQEADAIARLRTMLDGKMPGLTTDGAPDR